MGKQRFYQDVESNPDFSQLEENVLHRWKHAHTFQSSIDQRDGEEEFIFYDGPPFANGLPHYGHLLTGYVKDVFARYQTMRGKKVDRKFGWDCHGLPAEMGAEKELNVSGRASIMEFGIDQFNQHCQTSVMKYANEWQHYVHRQARWVDFEGGYKTMDKNYMESVIWAFKQLYDKGLVYESMRVMPYSWACETPLSNFETRMDNAYRERADKAVTVGFLLNEAPEGAPTAKEYRLMAWTTTPWTLPSNLAAAVGPELDYAFVVKDEICYLVGAFALGTYKKELGLDDDALEQVQTVKGSTLVGIDYSPLFNYFSNKSNAFKVISAEFVEAGEGTGVVHLAPGFGEDDQAVCAEAGIDLVCPVDSAGKFTSEVPDYQGMQVFEANDPIIIALKETGAWVKTDQYIHNYPHCWRTDTPLIYKAVPSWYVEVTQFKDRMVELNQQINWIPGHIKDGLFGKWLENARDWSISRNRFWGCPVPIWRSDDPKYPRIDVYGSIEELERDFGVEVMDLHRPFIDTLTRPNPDDPTGKSTMRRVEDVLDCWFESGSMPYAQAHYPFEHKDWFENHFPADFIVEYVAQTRGWFYTLMVLSTALFDRPPFLNCICHGVVLAEDGQKLSKRLKNYPDPWDIYNQYGSDAMRWYMMASPIMRGGELYVDKDGQAVKDTLRLVIKPLWNAYNFFVLYANSDGIEAHYRVDSNNIMDRYILSKLRETVHAIQASMDAYDTPGACQAVEAFFDVLNNWYIRRNRARFWKAEQDQDKQDAYDTLYSVLIALCQAVAPLMPLVSEEIYSGLVHDNSASVHLTLFPDVDSFPGDAELVRDMDRVRDACNAGLSVRNAENIRIRQPLQMLTVVTKDASQLQLYAHLIQDEVNVKKIVFSDDIEQFASFELKINFPVLGKRLPEKMKQLIPASKKGEWEQNADGNIVILGETLTQEECSLTLKPKVDGGAQALSTNDALVVLDLNISETLRLEGIARDLVRLIQQSRKDADLNVSDRIVLTVQSDSDDVVQAVQQFAANDDYSIQEQTLAATLSVGDASSLQHSFDHVLNDQTVVVGFEVA